jgi:hypothetical protein
MTIRLCPPLPQVRRQGGVLLGMPTEPGQVETMPDVRARGDVPGTLVAKMLSDNPRKLYGLQQ